MKAIFSYFIFFSVLFFSQTHAQNKVGLVLSGGGATGFAHIGVIKALEERGIPIDYITGTSAGALVGSMYAVGWSPEEMEKLVTSPEFLLMASGEVRPANRFLYKETDPNASLIDFAFAKDSIFRKSLPTNFSSSEYLDYFMMKFLGTTGASYGKNFDSLFVPYRCVGSDIAAKKSVVFSDGNLNQAVRASMTFPFYLSPIKINNVLFFDGGLYNNFPKDVMYNEFSPDYIIGSNVSGSTSPPSEGDLISQVTNMLVFYQTFDLPCEAGIIIEPKTDVNTFDFDKVKQAIDDGYRSALKSLDSIEMHVRRKVTKEELAERRSQFKSRVVPINISSISSNFNKRGEISYARKSMISSNKKKNPTFNETKLERRYFRLYATQQIGFMYPNLTLKSDSTYNLDLDVKKAKDFRLEVGGHFSSRAVNTGFIGLTYNNIGRFASSLHAESYFGKFYGSVKTEINFELPSIFPVSTSAYFTMNRWDYFRSFATFFEPVKPSFLIQNEMYYGVKFKHPIGNNQKGTIDIRGFNLRDNYYQTDNFTNQDTTDFTKFDGWSASWEFLQNNLNRKQYATSGHYFQIKFRYVNGIESTTPGSTSPLENFQSKHHAWINVKAEFQSFIVNTKAFHLGLHAKGVFNSQSLFTNYTATLLAMSTFSPTPDAETYFLPEYRSPQHLGAGVNIVFTVMKNFDIRLDGYFYQPFTQLIKNTDGTPAYSQPFKGDAFLASASVIYNSFIGPIRFTANYFPKQEKPLLFQFSYGYVLFNERAIR
ncbi:MAG: patatin-like phospholipase family protein [Bacteroidota bacterium]